MKKMRKTKYLLIASVLLFFLSVAGYGGWAWNKYSPLYGELQKKDPELFDVILKEARGFNIIEALSLAMDLNRMTANQARWNRYRRWKQKLRDDKDFKREVMLKRRALWEQARADQVKFYPGQTNEGLNAQTPAKYWRDRRPWQKGMLLREICHKIISEARKLPADFCVQAIPLGHDERSVARALENLKMEMDYFDFSQILSEAGIPSGNVMSHPAKLKKMTGSLGGA